MLLRSDRTQDLSVRSFPVSIQRRLFTTGRVRSVTLNSVCCHISRTGRSLLASGQFVTQRSVRDRRCAPSAATDRTRRSNRDQRPVTYSDLCLFGLGCRWHHRTIRTLRADTPPVKFLTLAQMCQPPSVSPCAHMLAFFRKHFQGC